MSEQEVEKMAKPVSIIQATNGYLVKVGCQDFVVEGHSDILLNYLSRYLKIDESIVEEFGYKGLDSFHRTDGSPQEATEEKWGCGEEKRCPAFNYLTNNKDVWGRKISTTYQFTNGQAIVNHETKEVIVTQKHMTDPTKPE